MKNKEPFRDQATLDALRDSVRSCKHRLERFAGPQHDPGHPGGTGVSVRKASHRGLDIEIETRQTIRVGGKELVGHSQVLNDGNVHYHAIPNMTFRSSVDMVKQIIDTFPNDFNLEPRITTGEKRGSHGEY